MKNKLLLIILLSFLGFLPAQDFGDISEEELKMTSFPDDPDADAVVLIHKSEALIDRDFNLVTTVHKRMKILTEAGKEYANIKIGFYEKDEILYLDGASYSPDGKEYELDSDNIFEEKTGNIKVKTFAIPGVEIGSIIEYEYKSVSKNLESLDPWYFQGDCYTVLSQYSIIIRSGFNYVKTDINCENYDIKVSNEEIPYPGNSNIKAMRYEWVAKNLPAIRKEPFVDNLEDNFAKMYFVLESYRDPYQYVKIGKSWDELVKYIYPRIEKFITDEDGTKELAEELTKDCKDDLEKAKVIYKFVRDEISNGNYVGYWNEKFLEPEKLLKEKKGGSAEKNILLMNLLERAGLKPLPVYISTRDNGKIIPNFCDNSQFNRIICFLPINKKAYYLTTHEEYLPFGAMSYSYDVTEGLIMREENSGVFSISTEKVLSRNEIKTEGEIKEDGTVILNSEISLRGYFAYDERQQIKKGNYKEYIKDEIKNLYEKAEIDTAYYTIEDSVTSTMKVFIKYRLPEYYDLSGEPAFLSIPFFNAIKKNPFVRQVRYYPVDFGYPYYTSEKVRLKLPAGYFMREIPDRKVREMPKCTYRNSFSAGADYFEASRSFNLKERQVPTVQYPDLRKLYEEMANSDSEEVVVTKTKPEPKK